MRVLEMLWVAACVAMLMILLSRNTINRKAGVIVGSLAVRCSPYSCWLRDTGGR